MKVLLFFFAVFTLFTSEKCLALDLDDGIEIDDSIDVYHELGEFQRNISFIVIDSMSRSSRATAKFAKIEDSDTESASAENSHSGSRKVQASTDELFALYDDGNSSLNTAAVNSIIIGAGSNIKGDIIIIDNSAGDHTAISK